MGCASSLMPTFSCLTARASLPSFSSMAAHSLYRWAHLYAICWFFRVLKASRPSSAL